MNKSFIFGALVGSAAGAGAMFVAMREYFRAKADSEITEAKEFYLEELKQMRKDNDEIINNAAEAVKEEEAKKSSDEPKSGAQQANENYEKVLEKENYSRISEEKKPKKEKKKTNKPYYITPEHFQDEPGFSKVTLDFWNGNGVFTNIEGGIEEEAGIWLDFEHNNEFGVYEPDLMYVRNDQMNTDYEVMFHEESYEGDDI